MGQGDSKTSNVGDTISAEEARWRFGGQSAPDFDTHVQRSVPYYEQGQELVVKLADFHLSEGSLAYELGCATGALTQRLGERAQALGARVVAVDIEPDMVEAARLRCAALDNVEVGTEDLVTMELAPSDLIVCYYTMQFVRPRCRQDVFDKLYASLNWGGALILFEKVRAPDARFQDTMTQLYTDYKLAQGYSEAEILAKSRSLKGVLEPFSTQGNLDLLGRAGFVDIMTVFKYLCFEGFLAIK